MKYLNLLMNPFQKILILSLNLIINICFSKLQIIYGTNNMNNMNECLLYN